MFTFCPSVGRFQHILEKGVGGVSGLLTRLYLLRCDILAKPRTKPEKEALNKES